MGKTNTMMINMDSDKEKSLKRVMWDGSNLHLHKGDEIEIRRGIMGKEGYKYEIRASVIANLSIGVGFRSRIEGVMMSRSPMDFDPPIRGYVENIEVNTNTYFDLIANGPCASQFGDS